MEPSALARFGQVGDIDKVSTVAHPSAGRTSLLASIGTAQWLILRRHVDRAAWWVVATALAWLAGLGVFFGISSPLWQQGQPVEVVILIGLGGGLLMAATSSVVTGLALRRLAH